MKLKLYTLLLAAVASVSSASVASGAPVIPDRLYFPNDRGTDWIFHDDDNTQVPRFRKTRLATSPHARCMLTVKRPEAKYSFS